MKKLTEAESDFTYLDRKNLILWIKASVVILSPILFFIQDLSVLFVDAYFNETMSYILAVPAILIYLMYRKRKMIKSLLLMEHKKEFKYISIDELLGFVLLFCSFLLYWFGSQTFSPLEYHLFALPFFVSGIILILHGFPLFRELIFPVVFLLLLIPPPADLLYSIGSFFSVTGSQIAYFLISLFSIPVTMAIEYGTPMFLVTQQNGTTLSFTVDVACSGIYSQLSFLIFSLFIAFIVRDKLWKKSIVFLLGFPVMFILNVIRITIILGLGYYFGADLALTTFHLLGGWVLIFIGTILILIFSEKILKIQIISSSLKQTELSLVPFKNNISKKLDAISQKRSKKIITKELVKLFSLLVILSFMFSIQAPIFALTQGPAEIIVQNPQGEETVEILPQIQGYTRTFEYRDEHFEQIANQDASLMYAYHPIDNTKKTVWIAIEIADGKSSLHRWEYCLITGRLENDKEPLAEQKVLETVKLNENPPIIASYFVFWPPRPYYEGKYEAVLYWYETSIFQTNSTTDQKQVKISVITYADQTEDLQQLKEELLIFGDSINQYWQPIKMWSQVSLSFSEQSDFLLPVPFALLVLIGAFWFITENKSKKSKQRIFQKLPKLDKTIVDSIISINGIPNTENIITQYEKITNQKIFLSELNDRLEKLEDIGLVKEKIYNINDEPFLGWELQFSYKNKSGFDLNE